MPFKIEMIQEYGKWLIHKLIHHVWLSIRFNNLIDMYKTSWTKTIMFFFLSISPVQLLLITIEWACYFCTSIPSRSLFFIRKSVESWHLDLLTWKLNEEIINPLTPGEEINISLTLPRFEPRISCSESQCTDHYAMALPKKTKKIQ